MLPTAANALALPDPFAVQNADSVSCPLRPFEPAISARPADPRDATKSAAILGGQSSALERIRQQQTGLVPEAQPPVQLATAPQLPVSYSNSCLAIAMPMPTTPLTASPLQSATRSDEFLDTARVSIGMTPFNDDWQRVSASRLDSSNVAGLVADSSSRVETLASVNRWANRRVEYADDIANYGSRDYWATASETLRSGRGDCEDYAILKYQMLAALGFDRSRMFLTLARDLVRNADHAVLIVEVEGRHYMLDNATDVLLPANVGYDYRPTMSFNSETAWLHGYSRRASTMTQLSYLSDSAVSSARVTGFNR
ncbi:transglutaminase-like cysteine peptidase [Aurantiacibacter odishensis]|uniref:transglutaminase-like cysteine peptidase n=1 Tax=Aurantiacibacter odishensis TaxID=1155476 RepID=UPI000E71A3FD|nr:transglutaminase-like cysteine peptidase [Aurantiacibacter odishensis]